MTKYNSSELDSAALRAAQDRFANENRSAEPGGQPPAPPAAPDQPDTGQGSPSLGQALESQAAPDNEPPPPAHNPVAEGYPDTQTPAAALEPEPHVDPAPAHRAAVPPLYHPTPEAPRHATPDTPAAGNPPQTAPPPTPGLPPRPTHYGQSQPPGQGISPVSPQRPTQQFTPPPPPSWPQRPAGFGAQSHPDVERTEVVQRRDVYPGPGSDWPRPPQTPAAPSQESYGGFPSQPPGPGPDAGYGQHPRGGFTATPRQPAPFTPAGDRGADRSFTLQSQRKEGPQQGWRAKLHRMHIPVGKSAAEVEYDLDISKINKVLRYPKAIGFAALKGGVGKTVCAMSIASTIAAHRQKGEVVALDTDHSGSLARRVRGDQISDIKRFVADEQLYSANDVKAHMQSNHHRLSVLGSSREPLATALTPEEYLRALEVLQAGHLFTIVDMDHSAASPAYETVMRSLDALVVVTATSLDSAEASQDIMDWLRARKLNELLTRTVVLINHQSPAKPHLDLDATVSHFRNSEQHEVLEIPWDEHLAEAGPINLDLLNKTTRRQFVKVAAMLVDSLPPT